jgi:hypothetical protein
MAPDRKNDTSPRPQKEPKCSGRSLDRSASLSFSLTQRRPWSRHPRCVRCFTPRNRARKSSTATTTSSSPARHPTNSPPSRSPVTDPSSTSATQAHRGTFSLPCSENFTKAALVSRVTLTKPFEPFDVVAKWLPESPFAEAGTRGGRAPVRENDAGIAEGRAADHPGALAQSHEHLARIGFPATREHSLAAYGITRTR